MCDLKRACMLLLQSVVQSNDHRRSLHARQRDDRGRRGGGRGGGGGGRCEVKRWSNALLLFFVLFLAPCAKFIELAVRWDSRHVYSGGPHVQRAPAALLPGAAAP